MLCPFFYKNIAMKSSYYHISKFNLAAATGAGVRKLPVDIPENFNNIIGYGIITTTDGGDPNYKVGIDLAGDTIMNRVNHKMVEISEGVTPKDKLLPFELKVNKQNSFQIVVENNVQLSSSLSFEVVFLCLSDSQKQAHDYPASQNNAANQINSKTTYNPAY